MIDVDYMDRQIRSVRRRKRAQRDSFDKKLIQLHKEEVTSWKELRNLGWTELKPPVQRGYVRFFILRDDVRRTNHAPFYQKILDNVNTTLWSSNKDFKKRRRKFGKKIYVIREQSLCDVSEKDFWSYKFSEQERTYFYETLTHPKWSKQPVKVFRFSEPWRFVLRIQPNMITKVRIKDLDPETRLAEIKKYLDGDLRRYRLNKLLHGNNRWKWDQGPKEKYKDRFRNKSFADILNECGMETKSLAKAQTLGNPGGFSLGNWQPVNKVTELIIDFLASPFESLEKRAIECIDASLFCDNPLSLILLDQEKNIFKEANLPL